jgi:hypothetical protein
VVPAKGEGCTFELFGCTVQQVLSPCPNSPCCER